MLLALLVTVNLIELVTVVVLDVGSLWVVREVDFEELEHELIFIRLSTYVSLRSKRTNLYSKLINIPKFFVSIFPFS